MKTRIRGGAVASVVGIAIAGLVLTACGGNANASKTLNLTAKDRGRTVQVHTGDELTVALYSNASTGFRWVVTKEADARVLKLVASDYVTPETTLLGAGGQEVWRFEAVGEGTTGLELTYERASGEIAGEPFLISVEVTP